MARPSPLPLDAVDAALAGADLAGWSRTGDEIRAEIACSSFRAAIALVVEIGFLAEAADHHPDIDIRWRTVRLALTTHDAGGLTDLDLDLARRVNEVAAATPRG